MKGVFPIAATTFHEDGTVDYESQRSLIHYLIEQGAHGLGLFGNASEGYTLSAAERRALMELIVKENAGRVPLIAGSGHTGTDAAVELSKEMEELGADGLMVLPPYFLKTDGEGLVHYYHSIAEAVAIPLMVQDAPLLTTVAMPAALLVRLAREIPGVRMVKVEAPPTAPKFTALAEAASKGPDSLWRLERQLLHGRVGTRFGRNYAGQRYDRHVSQDLGLLPRGAARRRLERLHAHAAVGAV